MYMNFYRKPPLHLSLHSAIGRAAKTLAASALSMALACIFAAAVSAQSLPSSVRSSQMSPESTSGSAPSFAEDRRLRQGRQTRYVSEIPFEALARSGVKLPAADLKNLSDLAFIRGEYDAMRLWTEQDYAALNRMKPEERTWYLKVLRSESSLGALIERTARQSGGALHKFTHRLKSPSSAYEALHGRPDSAEDVKALKDLVRYCAVFETRDYTQGTLRTIAALQRSGFKVLSVWNAWTDAKYPYRAVNAAFASPGGESFEVQFHTVQGAPLNDATHALYEKRRLLKKGTAEYLEILKTQQDMTAAIEIPEGTERIISYNRSKS